MIYGLWALVGWRSEVLQGYGGGVMMEGWIAGLVGSVLSALVGVWVGHQLREGSATKEWLSLIHI